MSEIFSDNEAPLTKTKANCAGALSVSEALSKAVRIATKIEFAEATPDEHAIATFLFDSPLQRLYDFVQIAIKLPTRQNAVRPGATGLIQSSNIDVGTKGQYGSIAKFIVQRLNRRV